MHFGNMRQKLNPIHELFATGKLATPIVPIIPNVPR
jgi:hypothetical protein